MKRLSLPMYDLPELGWAHDGLCDALLAALSAAPAFAGIGLPDRRERPTALMPCWRDPELLLSQTCGYPLMHELKGAVRLVATPCYDAEGCDGAWMRSALLVRDGIAADGIAGLRGTAVCAMNAADSNSGMNLLRAAVAPWAREGRFFREVVTTGAHVSSIEAVAGGEADLAAIDCVTLALLRQVAPHRLAGLRVLGWTQATPGLPLVTSRESAPAHLAALRLALDRVSRDPLVRPALRALLIDRFEVLDEAAYARVLELEQEAAALSYPVLR